MSEPKTITQSLARFTVATQFDDASVVMTFNVACLGLPAIEIAIKAICLFDEICQQGLMPGPQGVGSIEIEGANVVFYVERPTRGLPNKITRTIRLALAAEVTPTAPLRPSLNS